MTTYKELADRLEKFAANCCIPDDENTPPREAAAILRSLDAQPVATVAEVHMSRYTLEWNGSPLPEGSALYAAPVAAQPPSHSVIAGVLFDFMGWLTTRKERLCLSSADDASPAVTAITEFAKMRNLSLDNAMVTDWQSGAAQASKPLSDAEIESGVPMHRKGSIAFRDGVRWAEQRHGIKERG